MIKSILKNNKYIYFFYRRYLFPYFIKQEKEILFLRDFKFNTSIDIGANVGTYTIELQKNSQKVLSFEPLKENISYLKHLIKDNVKIYNYALSNKNKFAYIYIPKINNDFDYALSTLNYKNINNFQNKKKVKIKLRKFDHLFFNIYSSEDIDFIKIDVEGHELEVLQGMNNFLKKNKPIFLIEIEKKYNVSFDEVYKFLTERNYKSFVLKEDQTLVYLNNKDFKKIINNRTYNNFFFIFSY